MISVYDIGNEAWGLNGDVVLKPTSGTMKQVAGGSYSMTMVHPMDPEGKWVHLAPEAVIKIPVPEQTISTAYAGQEVWIYATTGVVYLRDGTTEPETITYGTWSASVDYAVGSKVTWQGKNYRCTYFDDSSGQRNVPPPNSPWWTPVGNSTSGSAVLATLSTGEELYWISGEAEDDWWTMETMSGIRGYVKQAELTLSRHLLPEENGPYVIRDQLFRIKKVTVNSKSGEVSVEAEHVSYDQSGNLIRKAEISKATPLAAIYAVTSNLMMELKGEVSTNLVNESTTFTGKFEGKNLNYALLDPDNGIAAAFDAAVIRDNWKIYIMKKTNENRGFRLQYRKNMIGINWTRKTDGLITRVVPVAKDTEGNELYLPNPFVDSRGINHFPVIRMEKLSVDGQVGEDDGTDTDTTWTEESLYQEMQKKAEERYTIDKVDQEVHEVTVDFEMLGDTAEYPWMKDLEKVLIYDIVKVDNEMIGLSLDMQVTEMEWDFIREKITALKLTNVSEYGGRSVTGYNVTNESLDMRKLTSSVRKEIINATVSRVQRIYEK